MSSQICTTNLRFLFGNDDSIYDDNNFVCGGKGIFGCGLFQKPKWKFQEILTYCLLDFCSHLHVYMIKFLYVFLLPACTSCNKLQNVKITCTLGSFKQEARFESHCRRLSLWTMTPFASCPPSHDDPVISLWLHTARFRRWSYNARTKKKASSRIFTAFSSGISSNPSETDRARESGVF